MSKENPSRTATADGFKRPSWLIVVIVLGLIGFSWWQNSHVPQKEQAVETSDSHRAVGAGTNDPSANLPDENEPTFSDVMPEHDDIRQPASHPTKTTSNRSFEKLDETSWQVEGQTIRDLQGKVVFKGTIDLKPTLDRIERGQANRHRNDGSSFQNREGRLPRKSAGYYKEYVHPTPGESGPGPQRIITGKEGEVWYTSDHYKTFKQIK